MHPRFNLPLSHFNTNPRLQQNKVGKFLNEDISLNDDDPRDVNDPEINMMYHKPLPLDSYEIYENERNLIQPHNYYLHQDEDKFNFKDIAEEDDSLNPKSTNQYDHVYSCENFLTVVVVLLVKHSI
jgi:hypothetical protein